MKVMLAYLGRRGGGAVYSLEVARVLSRRVPLLAVISAGVQNRAQWHGCGFPLVEVPSTAARVGGPVVSALALLGNRSVWARVSEFDPDVVYYPMIHPLIPLVNLRVRGRPTVVTIHDPVLHAGERSLLIYHLQRFLARRASRVILLNRIQVDDAVRLGVPREVIDVVPHGELSYYARVGARACSAGVTHPPTLLFFGRILAYKGLDVLLKSFPLVRQAVPAARLLIVGSGDLRPYRRLMEGVEGLEVVNRWIPDDEVAAFFERATVVVVPYVDASQSGVIPLAYSFGLPVVASRVGGLREQVDDLCTGILVRPNDPAELAQACVRVLTDNSLRTALATNALGKALGQWSWDRVADAVLAVLRKAVGQPSVPPCSCC